LHLAESGDYEGFNAIVGVLMKENDFAATAIDVLRRDPELKHRITDICREAWQRKQASR
jgi:hypothetical protein